MQAAALGIIGLFALWLVAVGVLMIARPQRALDILGLTASSRRVNFAEQLPRLLAGLALVVRADAARAPQLFAIAGGFLAISSLVLLIMPLRWHAGYAIWWSRTLRPMAVRLIGPVSIAGGCRPDLRRPVPAFTVTRRMPAGTATPNRGGRQRRPSA